MPTISEMSHGFDEQGVQAYVDELKAIVLVEATDAIQDISEIQTACEANWEGKAREDFIEQLKVSTAHVAEQYQNLYEILTTEISELSFQMSEFDRNLIK